MTTQEKIKKLAPWFHNIHLPDGNQTAKNHFLGDFPEFKWNAIKKILPENLSGYKILDVGCNAGYYSIQFAKMGAEVLGIDVDEHYLKQARWVAKEFDVDDRIEFKQMQVYDLARSEEKFDLIWFMGVFYHLRYPLLALDILSRLTEKYLLFQTFSLPGREEMEIPGNIDFDKRSILNQEAWPKLAFIENELAGDPTNWWIANHQGILSLLKNCGFNVKNMPDDETYFAERNTAVPNIENTWNGSEYLSVIGKDWITTVEKKTGGKD